MVNTISNSLVLFRSEGTRRERRPFILVLVLLVLVAGGFGSAQRVAARNGWANARRFRVPLTVDAAGVARRDQTIEAAIDFDALLARSSQTAGVHTGTIQVVEVAADGAVLDAAVPFQFEPATDAAGAARGTLIFRLTGETAATAMRHYQVYFDLAGNNETVALSPAAPSDVTLTNTTDQGFAAYRIATPHAVYFYHKDGGGFSGLEDDDGNDWIAWNPNGGNGGDYRGIPNMVHPANGGFFHPGRTTSSSQIISQGAMKVTFESTSDDGKWKVRWEIFPDFARMTVLKTAGRYWFLYEGTPGGLLEKADFTMRSNQLMKSAFGKWSDDLEGEEWAYVADPGLNRSIFLVHHTQDSVVDSYMPSDDKRMTIFGFGRSGNRRFQNLVGDQFSFGLINSTNYQTVAQAVDGVLNQAQVTVGAVEQQ